MIDVEKKRVDGHGRSAHVLSKLLNRVRWLPLIEVTLCFLPRAVRASEGSDPGRMGDSFGPNNDRPDKVLSPAHVCRPLLLQ